jgi:hypothetical protein
LILLIRWSAKDNYGYGKRFLVGFIFSISIGVVYGLFAGLGGLIFADAIAEQAVEVTNQFGDFFSEFEDVEFEFDTIQAESTPILNLVGEFFGAIFYNAFFGSIFSLIVAAFFRAEEDGSEKKVTKKTTKKETK